MGSMTTSRMVIPRGRVSMNIITLATSLASIRLPDSFASFNFSSGQSAMKRGDDGTGRDRANADAVLEDLAAYSLDEAVYSPFGRRIDRLPRRGKVSR